MTKKAFTPAPATKYKNAKPFRPKRTAAGSRRERMAAVTMTAPLATQRTGANQSMSLTSVADATEEPSSATEAKVPI
jgi:hypothetical protein